MDVRGYGRVARAHWYLLLVGLVLGLAGAGSLALLTPRSYASETTLFLTTQRASSDSALAYEGALLAEDKALSYVELVTSQETLRQIVAQAGLDSRPSELAQNITATLLPDTALIVTRVTSDSPLRAQQISAVLAERFVAMVEDLERPEAPLAPSALTARVVDPPTLSTDPVSPQPLLYLALGSLLGLLAGLGAALVRDAVRRPVRSAGELSDATGAPVLGVIVRDRETTALPIALADRPEGARAEAFRRIRAQLSTGKPSRPGRVVAVVSPSYGDGRTSTACNLAVALARSGRHVALVDADLRRPRVGSVLPTGGGPGLGDLLRGADPETPALRTWGTSGLDILGAGHGNADRGDIGDVLASDRMGELLTDLAMSHDVVLIDTPPLVPIGDAMTIAPLCDGVILVARYGRTRLADVRAAVTTIDSVSTIIGTVLNGAPGGGSVVVRSADRAPDRGRPAANRPEPAPLELKVERSPRPSPQPRAARSGSD
jgi:Mrp family chromosome partitioning ATPase/capsular polysaccharide biosynthesis protein